MNPVIEIVDSEGSVSLPKLVDESPLDRIKTCQVVSESSKVDMDVVFDEERNMAYHVIKVTR